MTHVLPRALWLRYMADNPGRCSSWSATKPSTHSSMSRNTPLPPLVGAGAAGAKEEPGWKGCGAPPADGAEEAARVTKWWG